MVSEGTFSRRPLEEVSENGLQRRSLEMVSGGGLRRRFLEEVTEGGFWRRFLEEISGGGFVCNLHIFFVEQIIVFSFYEFDLPHQFSLAIERKEAFVI